MLKVIVGVICIHQLSLYLLISQFRKLTVDVACTPTFNEKVLWFAKGGESGSGPLFETSISPHVPETISSFSISQVDVSGVPSGSRGMLEQVYSAPVSQFTNSMAATSSAHPVFVVSTYSSHLDLL